MSLPLWRAGAETSVSSDRKACSARFKDRPCWGWACLLCSQAYLTVHESLRLLKCTLTLWLSRLLWGQAAQANGGKQRSTRHYSRVSSAFS